MNITSLISSQAQKRPQQEAIVEPVKKTLGIFSTKRKSLSFDALEKKIQQMSNTLTQEGVQKGSRVLLFVKPSFDFPIIVFA